MFADELVLRFDFVFLMTFGTRTSAWTRSRDIVDVLQPFMGCICATHM